SAQLARPCAGGPRAVSGGPPETPEARWKTSDASAPKPASRPAAEMSTPGACAPRSVALDTLREYVDWSPFFHAWELRGRYPAIFDDPTIGAQARELFDDAQKLLDQIVAKNLLTARGVYGFWSANSDGDDVVLYPDEARSEKL